MPLTTLVDGTAADAVVFNANYQFVVDKFSNGDSTADVRNLSLASLSTKDATCNDVTQYALNNPEVNLGVSDVNLGVDGTAIVTGDFYSQEWTDVSDRVVISGWASYTSKKVMYKIEGCLVYVYWSIHGVSNSHGGSFSVPHQHDPSISYNGVCYAVDDNVASPTGGRWAIDTGAAGTYIAIDPTWTGAGWTNSGNRICRGMAAYIKV